jgi:2',3'-cyclic-nucleotide 2'-phosphodiesterase (5'-nucleotidase family)
MERLTILHTNDIHGRLEGLARVATLVAGIRETSTHPVLYFDAGDIEDQGNRLSSMTKGEAVNRLLSAAGCDGAAVGNATLIRYGPMVLEQYANSIKHPLWLANVTMPDGSTIPGVRTSSILGFPGLRLGVIGLTDPFETYRKYFGLQLPEVIPLARELARSLRSQGAQFVLVLSHLGWQHEDARTLNDQTLAQELQNEIDLIIGAHTHHLLQHGEHIGRVWVAQAGKFAEHLGRIELEHSDHGWRVSSVLTTPVPSETPVSSTVLAKMTQIEKDLAAWLAEPICTLEGKFEAFDDREAAAGSLLPDALIDFWKAEIGLALGSSGVQRSLEAGILTRGELLERVPSSGNPGWCMVYGWQVLEIIRRGSELERAIERPRSLRGAAQGMMHVSNIICRDGIWFVGHEPLEPDRAYRVGSSDAELDARFGYVDAAWNLKIEYDSNLIMADVLEPYLQSLGSITPGPNRIAGATINPD